MPPLACREQPGRLPPGSADTRPARACGGGGPGRIAPHPLPPGPAAAGLPTDRIRRALPLLGRRAL